MINSSIPIYVKKAAETRTLTFDFVDKLAEDDTLTGSATVTYPSGLTQVATTRSGNKVLSRFSGGTEDTAYYVTCIVGTTNGDVLGLDVTVFVDQQEN